MSRILHTAVLLTVALMAARELCAPVCAAERVPQLPTEMSDDPALPSAPIEFYLPDSVDKLWRQALEGQDAELQMETASILMRLSTMDAQTLAISRSMTDELRNVFRTSSSHTARHVIASALMHLEIHEAADELFEFSQTGNRAAQLDVERTLTNWQYEPIRSHWLERLQNSATEPAQSLLLAIHGLAQAGVTDAVAPLTELAMDRTQDAERRLAAAEALGQLTQTGLQDSANNLASDASDRGIVDRMVAAKMLKGHRDDSTEQLLLQLAQDQRPTVAAIALTQLLEIDPALIHPLSESLLNSPDAAVRRLTAQSLRHQADPPAVQRLADLLHDPHPDVHDSVRESLQSLAQQEELTEEILQQLDRILAEDEWHGQEQAARLVGELDHKPAAGRLLELLRSDRAEVRITAAWALRKLRVEDTLPGMLEYATEITEVYWTGTSRTRDVRGLYDPMKDACMAHLFEAMGQAAYTPAEDLLLIFVPKKGRAGEFSRAAAIWALGVICADTPSPKVERTLLSRMTDISRTMPEFMQVRVNAAVSLGRMKSQEALGPMERVRQTIQEHNELSIACYWGICQVTDTPMEPPGPRRIRLGADFLKPIDRD